MKLDIKDIFPGFNAPTWKEEIKSERPVWFNCENCEHLCIINKKPIYAYCTKNDWVFKLFETDTRRTVCGGFKTKGEVK